MITDDWLVKLLSALPLVFMLGHALVRWLGQGVTITHDGERIDRELKMAQAKEWVAQNRRGYTNSISGQLLCTDGWGYPHVEPSVTEPLVSKHECRNCGAPHTRGQLACSYCRSDLT